MEHLAGVELPERCGMRDLLLIKGVSRGLSRSCHARLLDWLCAHEERQPPEHGARRIQGEVYRFDHEKTGRRNYRSYQSAYILSSTLSMSRRERKRVRQAIK